MEAERPYGELLAADPDWPEARSAAGWFYWRRSQFELDHGSLTRALALARKAADSAGRLNAGPLRDAEYQRLKAVVEFLLGDVLDKRGALGDANETKGHYEGGLEIFETLLASNPGSARAQRHVSVSLERLGDFLARRGAPGDAEQALGHYQRGLEVLEALLTANPGSAQAQVTYWCLWSV